MCVCVTPVHTCVYVFVESQALEECSTYLNQRQDLRWSFAGSNSERLWRLGEKVAPRTSGAVSRIKTPPPHRAGNVLTAVKGEEAVATRSVAFCLKSHGQQDSLDPSLADPLLQEQGTLGSPECNLR